MTTVDAVVVGAGPNGLVAANHLLDEGWTVLVLEAAPEVGGAVHSSRAVHPDFVHDTCSAFYPLAAASPALAPFALEEHGLRWVRAPAPLGHPTPEGHWALIHPDRTTTAAALDGAHPGDGDAWLHLCTQWDAIGEALVDGLLTPFPPLRAGCAGLARLPAAGGARLVRDLLAPVTDLAERRFGGRAARLLLAGSAAHADIPLHVPGSGLMGLLLTMLAQTVGYPAPEGGAAALSGALARRLDSRGGEIRCGAPVVGIDVVDGRARRVRIAGGEAVAARHAVVATVSAPALYGRLVDPRHLPPRITTGMARFRMDPGTVKVDWALDGSVPWASPPPVTPGTVHVAGSVAEMTEAMDQIDAGWVPAVPFLLAGQMTTTDPTRSPPGTESMWAYTHVPQHVLGDAGDGGVRGAWDREDRERVANRMQRRIERLAPGFGSRVLARRVLGPRELEAHDANLLGGAINGGTARLGQQLVLRPVPGTGRAETPVQGLYLGSAAAHPGGGVHGAPGMNAARAAVSARSRQRILGFRNPPRPRHEE